MGDWAIGGSGGFAALAGTVVSASSRAVAITSGAGNTKGSYTEICAAAASNAESRGFLLTVVLGSGGAGSWDNLFDIAIGGAGNEKIICANVGFCSRTARFGETLFMPVTVPASTRVAARFQSGNASNVYDVGLTLLPGTLKAFPGYAGCEGIGVDTSVSGGTAVTPGSNTKGSYAQLTASTSRAYKGFAVRLHTKNAVYTATELLVDIAIGAAASEVIIAPDLALGGADTAISAQFIPVQIPSGVRVAARMAGSATTGTGISLVGLY